MFIIVNCIHTLELKSTPALVDSTPLSRSWSDDGNLILICEDSFLNNYTDNYLHLFVYIGTDKLLKYVHEKKNLVSYYILTVGQTAWVKGLFRPIPAG
jgi:hypothetical protein